jgi:molybdopterin adenylyltransferase
MNRIDHIRILSTNISLKKGTIKTPVNQIELNHQGVIGDAHAGDWHRQISLLGKESFDRFAASAKRQLAYGEFAENLTTEGIELFKSKVGDRLIIGEIILEITQIGKKCHGKGCAIYNEVGNCVMPTEGIFAKVIHPGIIKKGDEMSFIPAAPKSYQAAIITLSDRASAGIYSDKSGKQIQSMLQEHFESNQLKHEIVYNLIPDDETRLHDLLSSLSKTCDVIFTSGGTGIGPRDITPEVVKSLLSKEIPGIMELIRVKYGMKNPAAAFSRSIAGMINQCFVFALPGSVKAVDEYMSEILPSLNHLFNMRDGVDKH